MNCPTCGRFLTWEPDAMKCLSCGYLKAHPRVLPLKPGWKNEGIGRVLAEKPPVPQTEEGQ